MNNSPSRAADSHDGQTLPRNVKSIDELDIRDIAFFLWNARLQILVGIILGACAFGLLSFSSRQSSYIAKFLLNIDSDSTSASENREIVDTLNKALKNPLIVKDFYDAIFPIEGEKNAAGESLSSRELALIEHTRDAIMDMVSASDSIRHTLEDPGVSLSIEAAQGKNSSVLEVKLPISQPIDLMQAKIVPVFNNVIDRINKDATNAYHDSIREKIPDVQGLMDDIRFSSHNQRQQLMMDSLSIRSEIASLEYELFEIGKNTEGFRKFLRYNEVVNLDRKSPTNQQSETNSANLLKGDGVARRIENLIQLKTILLSEKEITPDKATAIHERLAQAVLRQQELNTKLKVFSDMDQVLSQQLNDTITLRSINRFKLLPHIKLDPSYGSNPSRKNFGPKSPFAEAQQVHNRNAYRAAVLGGLAGAFVTLLIVCFRSLETMGVLRFLSQRQTSGNDALKYSQSELKESTP